MLNTATAQDESGPDGLNDGLVEGFVNGELVDQWTGLRLRNLDSLYIDLISMAAFFGGSTDDWATTREEWILFDNFHLWTYTDAYLTANPEVKRGRQANNAGSWISTPLSNKRNTRAIILAKRSLLP